MIMGQKAIFLVDMQSFYASVEIADHPEWKGKPVIVSGDPERRSGVVLASSPEAKKYGVQNAWQLWEAQQNCPQAIIVRPRMKRYINVSMKITGILESFTDQVEPFSIDEQFMDVTGSQTLFGPPWTIAQKIQNAIMEETGVYARVGIAPNKVLAKTACDNFAKKVASGIFELNHDNMKVYMWPLSIDNMFGVGSRMEKHLRKWGVNTIGKLANFSLSPLKKRWGVNGQVLWMTANGIDHSPVTAESHSQVQKAIGHAMTLPKDYETASDIRTVLLELCEEVCFRARSAGVMGFTVSTGVMGVDFDRPTGFHRQIALLNATHNTIDIFHTVWELYTQFWDGQPVRRVGVNLSGLVSDENMQQLDLFEERPRKCAIGYAMDEIKRRFGDTSIMRAVSLTPAGQATERAAKIGGHYK